MKRCIVLVLISCLLSCDSFETRKVSSEEIVSQETKELDWHEVDQYPAFIECRDYLEPEAARSCFEEKVTNYFYAHLESKKPVVTTALQDTIYLFLTVSEKGIPSVDSVTIDSMVVDQLPEIRSWLIQSVDSLPEIFPATKRGIPVVTKFQMPIVIQAE